MRPAVVPRPTEAGSVAVPMAVEAERAVLCACLASAAALAEVQAILHVDDFYSDQHRAVWQALVAVAGHGADPDVLLVTEELREAGREAAVGGIGYLIGLSETLPDVGNAAHYAEIVRLTARRRDLLHLGQQLVSRVQDPANRVQDVLDDAGARIAVLSDAGAASPTTVEELAEAELTRIHAEAAGRAPGWVDTGFPRLDGMLHGMRPGDMVVLGARPSVGKSAFALNVAAHAARVQGKRVLFASLEMSPGQLMQRLLAADSGVSMTRIRDARLFGGSWSEWGGDFPLIEQAVRAYRRVPLRIVDRGVSSPAQVRARARAQQLREGLDMVVVDYMQLMDADERRRDLRETVTVVSKCCKLMAKDLGVPLLVLCQLNRAADTDQRKPRLHELRESGAIEQDADTVLLLHRKVRNEQETKREDGVASAMPDETGTATLIVAKQRQGPTGEIPFTFDGPTCAFHEGV